MLVIVFRKGMKRDERKGKGYIFLFREEKKTPS